MRPYRGIWLLTFAVALAPALCVPAIAQQSAAIVSPDQAASAPAPAPQNATAAQASSGTGWASSNADLTDNKWHYYGTLYIWFPGISGTVGIRGLKAGMHVTAGEIFSNFRGGIVGLFTPTYNRFSAPVDVMWMRLKDSKAIPFAPGYSVQALLNQAIITPKVSYLLVNNPKIKIYGAAGPRIWHVGTTLNLSPAILGRGLYNGPTWTDFVMGGRFSVPLGSKATVDILGDAGEGGATLDYQVAGFVNYQLKPKWALQGGWRYMTVHYGNNGNLFNATIQGIVLGATYKFK